MSVWTAWQAGAGLDRLDEASFRLLARGARVRALALQRAGSGGPGSARRPAVTRVDRLEYQRATDPRPQSPWQTFRAVHRHFRRSRAASPLGFLRYLGYYWGVDRPWKLAPRALRWGARRVGGARFNLPPRP